MTPQQQPNQPPTLNFSQVEALRKHMLLNVMQMAKLLGVSRVTYSGWVKGKSIRKGNDTKVRAALRKLFIVLTDHAWPMPNVIAMSPKQRFNALTELLAEHAEETTPAVAGVAEALPTE